MKKDCLLAIKPFIKDDDEFTMLAKAVDEGDIKTWDFFIEKSLDKFEKRKQLAIRKVAIEDGITTRLTELFTEDVKLKNLTEKLAASTDDKLSKKLTKKMVKRRSKVANDLMNGLWDDSGFYGKLGITSTYKEELAIYQTLVSEMSEGININPNVYGRTVRMVTQTHKLNLLKAVWGAQTKTKGASEIASAFRRAIEYSNKRLQRAGAEINPLEDYRLPNSYDPAKLVEHGREQFIADHINGSQYELRNNPDIKKAEYLPTDNPERFYGEMWDHITAGKGDAIPGVTIEHSRQPSLANRKTKFRYVNAVTADDWYRSASKYGRTDDPLEVMNISLQQQANKIVMLEKWGPSPREMWDNTLAGVRKSLNDQGIGNRADQVARNMTAGPVDPTDNVIRFMQGVRNFEAQHLLGSASLAAVSDIAFATNEAIFTGISPVKVVLRHMKGLVDNGNIEDAQAMGIISSEALRLAGQDHRIADAAGNGLLRRSVNFMLKASGLNRWTNAGKAAFGMEFLHATAKVIKTGKINPKLASAFERYGISIDELMELNGSIVKRKGVDFVNPSSLEVTDVALGDIQKRLLAMTIELTHSAIPEPGIGIRARLTAGTQAGTRGHETMKTLTQFMSFPASVAIRGVQRGFDASIPLGSRIGHAAGMFIGASALGGIIVQAKHLTKGNAMMDIDDPKFWTSAVLQGGAFGFISDVAFSTNPLLGPPTVRRVERLRKFMMGSFEKDEFLTLTEDWYKEIIPAALQTAEEATGFATNLWWNKVAFDRTIFNVTNRMANPFYDRDIDNVNDYLHKTNPTNEPWWRPGESTPEFMK